MVGVPRSEFFTTDYTDYTDFLFFFSREFAPFAVDLGSTMRNPKEPVFLQLLAGWGNFRDPGGGRSETCL